MFRGGWKTFKENLFGHPKTTITGLLTGIGGLLSLFGWNADPTVVGAVVSVITTILGIVSKDPGGK